jgi:hypothetical protein
MLDAGLVEAAISGAGDVAYSVSDGTWGFPRPEPLAWLPIGIVVLLQGVLVFALIRLRQPERQRLSMFQNSR